MITLWGRKNSINVQKALWCIEELGLPYERIDAGGGYGVTDTPEYGRLNPNRLVPTMEDNGLVLWESNAIVRYLSAKHGSGSLWPEDPAERALADKWMDYQLGTLFPAFKGALLGLVRTPPERRDQAKIEASASKTGEVLTILDAHLRGNEYVAGPSLTMGDIALGSIVYRWLQLEIERPDLPSLLAWHERLEGRPAYKRTVMVSFAMEDPPRHEA